MIKTLRNFCIQVAAKRLWYSATRHVIQLTPKSYQGACGASRVKSMKRTHWLWTPIMMGVLISCGGDNDQTSTPTPTPTPEPEPTPEVLTRRLDVTPGDTTVVEGAIAANQISEYLLSATEGQQLYLSVTGDGVLLTLLGPDNNPVNSRATGVSIWQGPLFADGDYTIILETLPELSESQYTLELELINSLPPIIPEPQPEPQPQPQPSNRSQPQISSLAVPLIKKVVEFEELFAPLLK